MKEKIKIIVFVFILFLLFSSVFFYYLKKERESFVFTNDIVPVVHEKPEVKTAELVFVGDVMLARGIDYYMRKSEDYSKHWQNVSGFLSNADIAFANLESPISDRGANVGGIYSFRANPIVIEGMKTAGIDIVSFANNHVWDWGRGAFEDTLDRLSASGITYVGAGLDYNESHYYKVFEKNDIKIAYLAYTNLVAKWLREDSASPSIAGIEKEKIAEDIFKAKQSGADIIITSFHFGEEYETTHNEYQESIAHFAIDNGANLVIGHHPHVAQDIELYKDGFIAYSLGNFIFDQNFSDDTSWGLGIRAFVSKEGIVSIEKAIFDFDEEFVPSLRGFYSVKESR